MGNLMGNSVMHLLKNALALGTVKPEDIRQLLPQDLLNCASDFFTFPSDPSMVRRLQVARLMELGYPKELNDKIGDPEQANALLVIPDNFFSLRSQMIHLGFEVALEDIWKNFYSDLTLRVLPYWVYDLNWVSFAFNHSKESLKEFLGVTDRRGFNFAEGLNLFAQFPMFFLRGHRGIALLEASSHQTALPLITVWHQDFYQYKAGPNCYYGSKGNHDIVPVCRK